MDFESAFKYLKSFLSYEDLISFKYSDENFDLERIKKFLDDFAVDYKSLKYVHVAGSKGKGSVSTLVASYLSKSGYKTGLFTSPFIIDVRDSFWLDFELISKDDFVSRVENIKLYIDSLGVCKLTYFELLTVLVLQYFVDKGVEYVVLEVGLGGRLDATNVVFPELCILTTVEKEHVDILGDNLKDILKEKLGIAKDGVPFIIGHQNALVRSFVEEYFVDRSLLYYVDDFVSYEVKTLKDGFLYVDFFFKGGSFLDLKVPFSGPAQLNNISSLILAVFILFSKFDESVLRMIVEGFYIPGRFDRRLVNGETVVFDMAHTVSSIENLLDGLKLTFPNKKFVFLVSIMKGKEVKQILSLLSESAFRIVLTSSHKERGFTARELSEFVEEDVEFYEDANFAYQKSLSLLDKEILVVTGSHFLVSELLRSYF